MPVVGDYVEETLHMLRGGYRTDQHVKPVENGCPWHDKRTSMRRRVDEGAMWHACQGNRSRCQRQPGTITPERLAPSPTRCMATINSYWEKDLMPV